MRKRDGLSALFLVAALVLLPLVPAAEKVDAEKIQKWIEQLGADSFADREAASKALDQIGAPALEALRKASKGGDAEIRKRAEALLAKIEKREESARVLTPRQVHLVCKDTPVAEAVVELAKKSGYKVVLHDPEGKLKDKKITLDTGKVSFWEALEKLQAVAELMEGDPNALPGGGGVPGGPVGAPGAGRRGRVPAVGPGGGAVAPPEKAVPAPAKEEKKEEKEVKKEETKKEEAKAEEAKKEALKNAAIRLAAIVAAQRVQPGVPVAVPAGPAGPAAPAGGGGPGVVRAPGGRSWVVIERGQITLLPGKNSRKADTATSIRVCQADPARYSFKTEAKEIGIVLEISPEPRYEWQAVLGVQIDKAIDDKDQKLLAMEDNARSDAPPPAVAIAVPGGVVMPGWVGPRPGMAWWPASTSAVHHYHAVKLQKGDKESKSLKELSGTISGRLLTEPEQMIVVDDVLKAQGKTVEGKYGGTISISRVNRQADGTIQIAFELQTPIEVLPETRIQRGIVPVAIPVNAPGGGIGIQIQILPAGAGGGVQPAVPAVPVAPRAVPANPKPAAGGGAAQPAAQPAAPAPQPAVNLLRGRLGSTTYTPWGLTLLDEKGNPLPAAITIQAGRAAGIGAAGMKQQFLATYTPTKDAPAEPAKLIYTGRRQVSVTVPFKLTDLECK